MVVKLSALRAGLPLQSELCYIKTHFGELDQNIAVHNHNTRQKLNLHVQFCRTNVSQEWCNEHGNKIV
jgi:hypothetical protein